MTDWLVQASLEETPGVSSRNQMSWFQLLVAHDSHTYASALAGVLTHVRPDFTVQLVRLDDLEKEMGRFPNAVVISDRLPAVAGRAAVGSILYYPELRDEIVVRLGGAERTITSPDLDDVIAAVDQLAACQAALESQISEESSPQLPPLAFGTT